MNRVLKRPMFRKGGSTGGITSGLRQGYANQSRVKQNDDWRSKQLGDVFTGKTTLGELQDISGAMQYKPRGTNVYDFMTELGLDLVSRPAAGNIFQQVATSAKEPYQRFMERKGTAAEQEYASKTDMFKTFLETAATATGEEGGRAYNVKVTADMIDGFIRSIDKNKRELQDETLSDDKIREKELQIKSDRANLRKIKGKNIYAEAALKSKKYVDGFVGTIMDRLAKEKNEDGTQKYPDPDNNEQLYRDAYNEFVAYFEEELDAEGGRVGYQMGQSVTGAAIPGAMPTDQGAPTELAPTELQGIDYETLRARLPATITDDIVRLIASSAEAMEDFATIQTQQDVDNFNKKYSVELVLPAEV